MKIKTQCMQNLFDPGTRALMRNDCRLRSYQAEALRTIYDAAMRKKGGRYTVVFPRQSGKNETQAQLESALMAANQDRGGSILKLIPTEKNQGAVSRKRLEKVLRGVSPETRKEIRSSNSKTSYGSTEVRCLSANPNSAIVGATADLLLEVDEAQMIRPAKYDREAAPMAAAANAVQVFWGTVWDDQTLLSRESRRAMREGDSGKKRFHFQTDAAKIAPEVPSYGEFVRAQVEKLGREHPVIRTQYFCEEISDLTSMFTPDRIENMRGSHQPQDGPKADRCYVFLIDIAGSDELTAQSRRENGFSDRRDATVLTICEVSMPKEDPDGAARPVWQTVARRYYRNVPGQQQEAAIAREIEFWQPARVILDHSGLGCMLSEGLSRRFRTLCFAYDITAAVKTRMAWGFLAMVDTGRWKEYEADPMLVTELSSFVPGRDRCEVIQDPALLQQMFFRELRACRMEPTLNAQVVRWGVPDGTRDGLNGRLIHDDLVMSAALCVLTEDNLPLVTELPDYNPGYFDLSYKDDSSYEDDFWD